MSSGLNCTHCDKEFEFGEDVVLKDTGVVFGTGAGPAYIEESGSPYVETLCRDCGDKLVIQEDPNADNYETLRTAALQAIEDLETGYRLTAKARLTSIIGALDVRGKSENPEPNRVLVRMASFASSYDISIYADRPGEIVAFFCAEAMERLVPDYEPQKLCVEQLNAKEVLDE